MKRTRLQPFVAAVAAMGLISGAGATPVEDFSKWSVFASGGSAYAAGSALSLSVMSLAGSVATAGGPTEFALDQQQSLIFGWRAGVWPGLGAAYLRLAADGYAGLGCVSGAGCGLYALPLADQIEPSWNGRFNIELHDGTMVLSFRESYVGTIGFTLLGNSVGAGPFASTGINITDLRTASVPEPGGLALLFLSLALMFGVQSRGGGTSTRKPHCRPTT